MVKPAELSQRTAQSVVLAAQTAAHRVTCIILRLVFVATPPLGTAAMIKMFTVFAFMAAYTAVFVGGPVFAQSSEEIGTTTRPELRPQSTEPSVAEPLPQSVARKRGPVTNLPLPRFVSMKASEANVRRGPSLTHRIDWVFKRRGMPLEVTAEYGHWRRVRDRDGAGGWVHYALISGTRTVLIEEDLTRAHARPDKTAPVIAAFELGVVARLGDCKVDWCEISADGHTGWALKTKLWGVAPDELRD